MLDKPRFRCSNLDQILRCPGSKLLTARAVKPAEDSSQATAGKYCHAVAAQRLKDQEGAIGPEIVPSDFSGEKFHEFIIGYYLDTVRLYVESYMALTVEEEYEYEFDRFILTGHMDCMGIDADAKEFCGLDLKAGMDPVIEAEENSQVLGYLVLLAMNYPTAAKRSEEHTSELQSRAIHY
jgi:hypothetical protein